MLLRVIGDDIILAFIMILKESCSSLIWLFTDIESVLEVMLAL